MLGHIGQTDIHSLGHLLTDQSPWRSRFRISSRLGGQGYDGLRRRLHEPFAFHFLLELGGGASRWLHYCLTKEYRDDTRRATCVRRELQEGIVVDGEEKQ